MRFHVVNLPHTNTTRGFGTCAYTQKVRLFCNMMTELGHEVYLYAGEYSEAQVSELVVCTTEEDREAAVGDKHYTEASFDYNLPHWRKFNAHAIEGIRNRIRSRDFICLIAGYAQKEIADAFPDKEYAVVEFGIGYGGSFARFRVWESYAWMHMCYGAQSNNNPHGVDGQEFDAVIPNYVDIRDLFYQYHKSDYIAYLGRFIDRKGYRAAIDICNRAGVKLLMAGPKDPSVNVDPAIYLGELDYAKKAALLGAARALIVPTRYIEPFGTVAIEAMICGTPVITSDWGAFTETVQNGKNGYRCRNLQEYIDAIRAVDKLDPVSIRKHAVEKYSTKAVGKKYQAYFERLSSLWADGWYQRRAA